MSKHKRVPARKPRKRHGPARLGPPQAAEPPIATPDVTLKLDLGCGHNCMPDFEGVDFVDVKGGPILDAEGKPTDKMHPDVKHVVDLFRFPWPWADGSVLEVHCSHFVEHLPMIEVDHEGNQVAYGKGQDLFLRWFDELYRVLHPDGVATIVVPSGRSNRAFQDPTHRRFLVEESFAYLAKEWRDAQRLDHYNVKCNFGVNVNQSIPRELQLMHEESARRHIINYWNTTIDLWVKLKPLKVSSPG